MATRSGFIGCRDEEDAANAIARHASERRGQVVRRSDLHGPKGHPQLAGRVVHCFEVGCRCRLWEAPRVPKQSNPRGAGCDLGQELQFLRPQILGRDYCRAGYLASRLRQAHDKARQNRIARGDHDNRNYGRRGLGRMRRRGPCRYDHVHLEPHQLDRENGKPVNTSLRRSRPMARFRPST